LNLLQDICGFGRPDEGFGLAVVLLDVLEDAVLKLLDAGEDAALELVFGQVAEEAIDHVEPITGGRREVEMEARMPCGPCEHVGMLVRGVVVDDEMKLFFLMGLGVGRTQELEPLLMEVALNAGGHHGAIERSARQTAWEHRAPTQQHPP
jgi:hypothetical protein